MLLVAYTSVSCSRVSGPTTLANAPSVSGPPPDTTGSDDLLKPKQRIVWVGRLKESTEMKRLPVKLCSSHHYILHAFVGVESTQRPRAAAGGMSGAFRSTRPCNCWCVESASLCSRSTMYQVPPSQLLYYTLVWRKVALFGRYTSRTMCSLHVECNWDILSLIASTST